MSVKQIQQQRSLPLNATPSHQPLWHLRPIPRLRGRLISLSIALLLLGGSALPASLANQRQLTLITEGWGFNLIRWEVGAIGDKINAFFAKPALALSPNDSIQLVRDYLARANQIRQLEIQINEAIPTGQPNLESARWQQDLAALRQSQHTQRETVEQVIERQVGWALVEAQLDLAGLPAPPVQFTFIEPPKKLVVSSRRQIETVYSEMLAAEISRAAVEGIEQRIHDEHDLSAYVTHIGGLGAFPTMVVDQASLGWILSTVAHEWAHNYLSFFPLGLNYLTNGDLTTINETVAEIVGYEIGERVRQAFYPEEAPLPKPFAEPEPLSADPLAFDFSIEMRATRRTVEELLALDQVEAAERYMEVRRLYFVENGYPLRVLNQAYFAFHGSYATGPASISPLGPKLEQLRRLTPNLKTFLVKVRGFDSVADLDEALADP